MLRRRRRGWPKSRNPPLPNLESLVKAPPHRHTPNRKGRKPCRRPSRSNPPSPPPKKEKTQPTTQKKGKTQPRKDPTYNLTNQPTTQKKGEPRPTWESTDATLDANSSNTGREWSRVDWRRAWKGGGGGGRVAGQRPLGAATAPDTGQKPAAALQGGECDQFRAGRAAATPTCDSAIANNPAAPPPKLQTFPQQRAPPTAPPHPSHPTPLPAPPPPKHVSATPPHPPRPPTCRAPPKGPPTPALNVFACSIPDPPALPPPPHPTPPHPTPPKTTPHPDPPPAAAPPHPRCP